MRGARPSVLLASGGMDSTVLYYELVSNSVAVTPLFVNYGQHCAEEELATLRKVLPKSRLDELQVINVSDIYRGSESLLISPAELWAGDIDYKSLYLPYRSLLLLAVGAAYGQAHGAPTLYSAFINSNHAQEIDCSVGFFRELEHVLTNFGGIELQLPYREYTKVDVLRRGIELGVDVGMTFSCQLRPDVPCGACPNCVDRLDALNKIGIETGESTQ